MLSTAAVPASDLVAAAERSVDLGRHDLAQDLLDLAVATGGGRHALTVRRRLPGYVGDVAPELVACASAAAGSRDDDRGAGGALAVAVAAGRGGDVEAVVRHHLPDGRSMIRKTLHGAAPRELLVYRSGLIDRPGRLWRAPELYLAAEDEPQRWHLFLEDLGDVRPLETPDALIAMARAVGEMNARHLGDASLRVRFPWLLDGIGRPLGRVRPRAAAKLLAGCVDDEVARRVTRTLRRLAEHASALATAHAELPRTLCHGDANPANAVAVRDRVVLIDWTKASRGAVGIDLAKILGVANRTVRHAPTTVDACLAAYTDGLGAHGGASVAEIELGYRHRLVAAWFPVQLQRLPPPAGGALARAWSARRRRIAEANLTRLCDEADRLLALVGV